MAINTVTAAALAATIALAGCVSPYETAIKSDLAACQAGDQSACQDERNLQVQDAQWHAQKNQEVGNALLGVLAVGVAAAGIAAAAHAPPPPPPPVVFVRPPLVFVP